MPLWVYRLKTFDVLHSFSNWLIRNHLIFWFLKSNLFKYIIFAIFINVYYSSMYTYYSSHIFATHCIPHGLTNCIYFKFIRHIFGSLLSQSKRINCPVIHFFKTEPTLLCRFLRFTWVNSGLKLGDSLNIYSYYLSSRTGLNNSMTNKKQTF